MLPGSCSMVVIAAVAPGTKTDATPAPVVRSTRSATPGVMSTTSPFPSVLKRSCALVLGKELFQPRHLVRRHRVAVFGLRVLAPADVGSERLDALDHRLAQIAVALHEARGVAVV